MKKKVIVTTSWDDGHKDDLILAELLEKYELPATFYISPNDREFEKKDLLTSAQIKKLSETFEIGAHTMVHNDLAKLPYDDAYKNIQESKQYLEKIINKQVVSFSYPYGSFKKETKEIVRKIGFSSARTTNQMITAIPKDKFEIGTTIEFTPQTLLGISGQYKLAIKNKNLAALSYLSKNWIKNVENTFDFVMDKGGVYHLWGHSWIIQKNDQWPILENLFKYISRRREVIYVPNCGLGELYE